jgi:hypothetical protein
LNSAPIGLSIAAAFSFALTCLFVAQDSGRDASPLLAPPPEHIELMHFGFASSVADSLWLRWIQDADTCYSYFGPVEKLEVGKAVSATKDNPLYNPRHKICDSSWGFKMLDAVTKLDPLFKMPYMAGAMALSVLVEDYKGASVIFERGLEAYPDDWQLNYRAAYHFLFDVSDMAKAARLLEQASDRGGPVWLKSLAARLYSKTGQLELGLVTLLAYRKAFKEGAPGIKDVDRRIAELKSELEKEKSSK